MLPSIRSNKSSFRVSSVWKMVDNGECAKRIHRHRECNAFGAKCAYKFRRRIVYEANRNRNRDIRLHSRDIVYDFTFHVLCLFCATLNGSSSLVYVDDDDTHGTVCKVVECRYRSRKWLRSSYSVSVIVSRSALHAHEMRYKFYTHYHNISLQFGFDYHIVCLFLCVAPLSCRVIGFCSTKISRQRRSKHLVGRLS